MKAALIISSIAAITTCGPLGTYILSRESIKEKVDGFCILESAEIEGWKLAEAKLKNLQSSDSLASPFKELYEKIKETQTGNLLKKVCLDLYSQDSSSIFKKENSKLTEQIKNHCSLTIKERLGDDNIFKKYDESEKTQEKVDELKSHAEDKGILTDNLKTLIGEDSSNKTEGFKLACENLYKKSFLSEKSNDWKLAEAYCKKSSK